MNAEFVNVIIQSVKGVLKSVCGENTEVKKAQFITKEFDFHDFNIYIGIIYDVKANIIISGSDEVGHQIASKMIMSEVNEWSEIAVSAVKELTNMMAGTCSIKFSQFSKNTDITVPKFYAEQSRVNVDKIVDDKLLVRIPLVLNDNKVVNVSIQFLDQY